MTSLDAKLRIYARFPVGELVKKLTIARSAQCVLRDSRCAASSE
jgi:hypothetical protein